MFWDRRKKDRRDAKGNDAPEQERRDQSERIESWLEANAEDRWAVGLDSIDEGLSSKVLKIMFENQDDKEAFIQAFSRRR